MWDASRRAAVERSFSATALPYATATFEHVAGTLDRYASAWMAMHDEVCRAPSEHEAQTDSLRDLRMACLEALIGGRRNAIGAAA